MPRRTPDVGVNTFEVRPGMQVERLRGVNRSADPASVPLDQFHLLANVRLTPAGMIDRPGLKTDSQSSESGCIPGMIEVKETGVGLWVTPSYGGAALTYPGTMQLANFNEEKTASLVGQDYDQYADREDQRADFRRYGYQELNDPPLLTSGGAGTVRFPQARVGAYLDPAPQSRLPGEGSATIDGLWTSLLKYRKRFLQVGTRQTEDPEDESSSIFYECLWSLSLPEKEEKIEVGYQVYEDLWRISALDDGRITSIAQVFGRFDDPVTGEEGIQEYLYFGRSDGKVYSFDGTTVQEEYDFGVAVSVRVSTWNKMGILAVANNQTAHRFIEGPGAAWQAVTSSAALIPNDMADWGGKVYLVTSEEPNARVWTFDQSLLTISPVFSLPARAVPGSPDQPGLFFSRAGNLYFVQVDRSAFNWTWEVYRRVTDVNWVTNGQINFAQDFLGLIDWVLVTGAGRVLFGGGWGDQDPPPDGLTRFDEKMAIVEAYNWTASSVSLRALYWNTIPTEEGPDVGRQAIIVAPEDIVLNDEEL